MGRFFNMVKHKTLAMIGGLSFISGVFIALLVGIFANYGTASMTSLLIVLGILVGFLNVTGKESKDFLLTAVGLIIVTAFGGDVLREVATIGVYLSNILGAMMMFLIPSVIVVALKIVYAIAKRG